MSTMLSTHGIALSPIYLFNQKKTCPDLKPSSSKKGLSLSINKQKGNACRNLFISPKNNNLNTGNKQFIKLQSSRRKYSTNNEVQLNQDMIDQIFKSISKNKDKTKIKNVFKMQEDNQSLKLNLLGVRKRTIKLILKPKTEQAKYAYTCRQMTTKNTESDINYYPDKRGQSCNNLITFGSIELKSIPQQLQTFRSQRISYATRPSAQNMIRIQSEEYTIY